MKRFFLFLFLSTTVNAATVVGKLSDITGETMNFTPKFEAIKVPYKEGTNTIFDGIRFANVIDGFFRIDVLGGVYNVYYSTTNPPVVCYVPISTNVYQFSELITNIPTFYGTNFPGVISTKIVAGTNVNIDVANEGTPEEVITISSTGGGSATNSFIPTNLITGNINATNTEANTFRGDILTEGKISGDGSLITNLPIEGYFISSYTGDDNNTGTQAKPWKTINKALSLIYTNTSTTNQIWLQRGSVFREDVKLPSNTFVGAYDIGTNPIVSGADLLTNSYFYPDGICTNTYVYHIVPNIHTAFVTSSNVLMVWEDSYRLGGGGVYTRLPDRNNLSGTNSVCTTPGSWWFNTTNKLLYVHLSDGGDPRTNNKVYEASVRTLCVWSGTNTVCEDIIAEKAGAMNTVGSQGYLFFGDSNNTLRRCIGRHAGFTHAIGVANASSGYFNCYDCLAEDCPTNMSSTPFVWYKSGASTGTGIASNCWARQTLPGDNNYPTYGFYAHDEVGATSCKIKVVLYDCGVENCEIAQGPYTINSDAMSIATNTWCYGTNTGWAPGVLQSNYTMKLYIKSGSVHPQVNGTLNLIDSTLYESSAKMYSGSTFNITNCTFYSAGGDKMFIIGGLSGVYCNSVSNKFLGGLTVYASDNAANQFVSFADYNIYKVNYGVVMRYWSPYNALGLSDWQTASGLDSHSTSIGSIPLSVTTFNKQSGILIPFSVGSSYTYDSSPLSNSLQTQIFDLSNSISSGTSITNVYATNIVGNFPAATLAAPALSNGVLQVSAGNMQWYKSPSFGSWIHACKEGGDDFLFWGPYAYSNVLSHSWDATNNNSLVFSVPGTGGKYNAFRVNQAGNTIFNGWVGVGKQPSLEFDIKGSGGFSGELSIGQGFRAHLGKVTNDFEVGLNLRANGFYTTNAGYIGGELKVVGAIVGNLITGTNYNGYSFTEMVDTNWIKSYVNTATNDSFIVMTNYVASHSSTNNLTTNQVTSIASSLILDATNSTYIASTNSAGTIAANLVQRGTNGYLRATNGTGYNTKFYNNIEFHVTGGNDLLMIYGASQGRGLRGMDGGLLFFPQEDLSQGAFGLLTNGAFITNSLTVKSNTIVEGGLTASTLANSLGTFSVDASGNVTCASNTVLGNVKATGNMASDKVYAANGFYGSGANLSNIRPAGFSTMWTYIMGGISMQDVNLYLYSFIGITVTNHIQFTPSIAYVNWTELSFRPTNNFIVAWPTNMVVIPTNGLTLTNLAESEPYTNWCILVPARKVLDVTLKKCGASEHLTNFIWRWNLQP